LFQDITDLKGETKMRAVKTRVNQNVFRQIVLANYGNKCAITGIDVPDLLLASHIIPWAMNTEERLNPENGICLSALYDKAFDKGLIGINSNYEIILSNRIKTNEGKDYYTEYFKPIDRMRLRMPQR
jgi:putative restriction endonuclease